MFAGKAAAGLIIGFNLHIFLFAAAATNECVKKLYNNKRALILCVCNATYCDTVEPVGSLERYEAAVYTTSRSGRRLQRRTDVFVDEEKLKEDSAGINFKSLPPDALNNLLKSYYGQDGIQYSLGRIPIASCDFSTHEYSYDDTPGDFELKNFKLAKEDIAFKIPFIRKALNLTNNDLRLFASPWSAPGWMKTNGEMRGGGSLINDPAHRYHIAWAKYYIRFLEEYAKNGINFWGLTVQNEPSSGALPDYKWQTMFFSSETEREFVRDYLGQALKNSSVGKDIALMILDDNRYWLPVWPDHVLRDRKAANYVSGIAVHWYSNYPIFSPSRLSETHENHPDKFILSTEASFSCFFRVQIVCTACNGNLFWEQGPKPGSWTRAENYAKDIIENLENWVVGWTDWNLALDLQGGPNWVKNFVDSPILVNASGSEFYKQPMFYIMGHFSKFLRPGYVRIGIQLPNNLKGVVFASQSQQRVLVLQNLSNFPVKNLIIQDATMISKTMTVELEPRSITTIIWSKTR
ncbi:unnamed protein product [Enterobius vermicularis]|uniref:Glucosylceramidase n=1 Tax=Enterobius vermicularis TaxID=51028 RepID=A0A0N4V3Q4_ENTVE|nr:unnamed protein product [Enterobius vermicularis]